MYGFHPANLALRFVLELAAFVGLALGGYAIADGALAWILAIALPLVGVVAWGTFNVPGDRSRNGEAPVPVPGIVRLMIELDVFGAAIILSWFAAPWFSVALGVGVVVHYALSTDRIAWLMGAKRADPTD